MAKAAEPIPNYDIHSLSSAIDLAVKGTLGGFEHDPLPKFWLPTGITLVDALFHRNCWGVPCGRPIHLYGPPKSGKSFLGYMLGKAAQDRGGIFVVIDTEHFPTGLANIIGVNLDKRLGNFLYYRPPTLELGLDAVEKIYVQCKDSPVPIVVLYDSMAGNDALSNMDSVMAGATYQQGKPPQLWSRFFKRPAVKQAYYSQIYMVYTNQVRLNFDFFSRGPAKVEPLGGYGVAHSMHIEVGCATGNLFYSGGSGNRERSKAKDKTVVGTWLQSKVTKNREGPSHNPVGFPIYYNWGMDDVLANLEYLKDHAKDEFKLSGSMYSFDGAKKYFSQWHKAALGDPELSDTLRNLVIERYQSDHHTWSEERR